MKTSRHEKSGVDEINAALDLLVQRAPNDADGSAVTAS